MLVLDPDQFYMLMESILNEIAKELLTQVANDFVQDDKRRESR